MKEKFLARTNIIKNKFTHKGKSSFYIILGDEGIILLLVSKDNKVEMRLFFDNLEDAANLERFEEFILVSPDLPVNLVIDTIDLNFQLQSFPPVNKYTIQSLARKKLNRSFNDDFLKGLIQVKGSDAQNKEWLYLFISLPISGTLSKTLELIYSLANPFISIRLLAVETTNLLNQLLSSHTEYQKIASQEYQMLILHNKVSGIRQVVFKNRKIFFTRLINIDQEEYPDVIAGNINQEIKNSFEYLNRNYNIEIKNVGITIIIAEQVKQAIKDQHEIKAEHILFTPYEASKLLSISNGVLADDKYSDIVAVLALHSSKPILPLHTIHGYKLYRFTIAKRLLFYSSFILAIVLILYVVNIFLQTKDINVDISQHNQQFEQINQRISERKNSSKIDSKENILIIESVSIFKNISEDQLPPNVLLKQFYEDSQQDLRILSVEWKKDNSPTNPQLSKTNIKSKIILNLKINFINKGRGYQDLFNNFENFTKRLKVKFSNYQVEYSRINQQIGLANNDNQLIPVDITIKGPIK